MALTIKNGKDLYGRTPMSPNQLYGRTPINPARLRPGGDLNFRATTTTYGAPPPGFGYGGTPAQAAGTPYTGPGPKAAPFTAPEAMGQPTNLDVAPTPNIFQGGAGSIGQPSDLPDPRDLWREDTAIDDRSQITPSLEETRRRRSSF
jgi:hypothetical protein